MAKFCAAPALGNAITNRLSRCKYLGRSADSLPIPGNLIRFLCVQLKWRENFDVESLNLLGFTLLFIAGILWRKP